MTRAAIAAYKCSVRTIRVVTLLGLLAACPCLPALAQAPAATAAASSLRAQAEAAMQASQFGEAEALYAKIVAAAPTDAVAHMQLGISRAMGGRIDSAVAPLREALRLRPDLLPARLFLGISYLELGRPGDAVAPLRQVLDADKTNMNARQALVEALLALDRHAEASTELAALSAAQPQSAQVWAALGRSYEGIAREAFEKLQGTAVDSPYVWLLVADVLTVQEKYPQAFSLIRDAQAALPDLPGVHRLLARVYAASGHADWAAVEEQRATAEKPPCATLPVACAYLSGRLEDALARTASASQPAALYWRARAANDLAARAFETLEKLPPSVERYVIRAGIARDQEQPLEAVAQLREALKLAPDDPGLERELAGALHAARDFEAALPLLEKLHRMAPDAPDVLLALGDTLLQSQQVPRAVALLEKAVAATPGLLPAHAALGRALLQSGDTARAIPHLEKALPTDTDGSLYYQLAQAMQRTGNGERARTLLAEYQKRAEAAAPAPTTPAETSVITAPVP